MGLALAAPGSAPAQVDFASSISVVSLPVFVTDANGRAVAGLDPEQFEVLDDGRRVRVVGFREIDAEDPEAAEELRHAPAARRQFLLLFDLSFSSVGGLNRAREATLDFVSHRLQPLDLAAVATFSANHGLRVLLGFTSDKAQLRKAVSTLGVLQLDRKADPLGLVYDLTEAGSAFADTTLEDGSMDFESAGFAVQVRYRQAEMASYTRRVEALFDGLGGLARSLDGFQGRKQVLLLSEGFDATAFSGEQGARSFESSEALARGQYWAVRPEDRYGDATLRAEIRDALHAFSTADAVVHSVDLTGLAARGSARSSGREPARASGRESLAMIAELAGGRHFKDTNDVGRALEDVLELSRRYYLLAIEPERVKGPGSFHQLKVRVKAKGTRVSHRSGYFEREDFAQRSPLTRRFEAAEIIAKGITGGDLEMRVLAVPYRTVQGRSLLPVVLEIDGASLLEGTAPEGTLGLEIYGYALKPDGSVEDLVAFASNLDLATVGPKLGRRGLQCHASFSLPPGPHELRFLARDAETGRQAARWLQLTVPDFQPGDVQLAPPIFMDDPQQWLILSVDSRSTQAAETPFRIAAERFAPRARPTLENGAASRFMLLAFDGGVQYDPGASFQIQPQLLDAQGVAVPLGGFQVAHAYAETDGFRRFVMNVTPNELPPGDYTLKVSLRDPGSGRISEAFQSVTVLAAR